jgi:integrase/recombinase XerC/integrase/recombinase XerD
MADVSRARNVRIPRDKPADGWPAAIDAFLSQPGLSEQTRRSYRLTLAALTAALDSAGAEPTGEALEAAAPLRWATVAPATWNRHAATVRSFLGYAARHRLLPEIDVTLDRRREPADRTRALPKAALERLWARRDIPLVDKTLWRLLYETAARAGEALSLNVEDLDLANRRAVIRGKNGELDFLHWQTGSGHLLSRLIADRTSGPVFLTDRRASAGRAPAAVDLCPHTGRGRLSYRRAQERFAEATGGWTLHQLRHSALTHLAEANVGLPLLMAKSRHTSLRSLQKYARPGVDAVARLTAEHDPARRRR